MPTQIFAPFVRDRSRAKMNRLNRPRAWSHGSRGAVTAPWAAHLLAARAFGEPVDLTPEQLARLAPDR